MRFGTLKNALGLSNLGNRIAEFRRDESGVMIVFTLYLFIAMLIITGLSIDLARVELVRTKLQNTLDRAILAATNLSNSASTDDEVKAIILDYFNKAGLDSYITPDQINVEGDNVNSRKITVAVSAVVPSWFMKFAGVDSLIAPASAGAEQGNSDIEIILVLDVSGSMHISGRQLTYRLDNLKESATDFVTKILTTPGNEGVTIGIVMYNSHVQVEPSLLSQYTLSRNQNTRCIDFADSDFTSVSANPATPLVGYQLFDPYGRVYNRAANASRSYCSNNPGQLMVLPTNNLATLTAAIGKAPAGGSTFNNQGTGMQAGGWTSIDTGLKWGVALLDPSLRSFYNTFLPAASQGRPFNWGEPGSKKFIVLMSDGDNTRQYEIIDDTSSLYASPDTLYETGMSPIWVNPSNQMSVFVPRGQNNSESNPGNQFYRIGTETGRVSYDEADWNATAFPDSVQLSWDQATAAYSLRWIGRNVLHVPNTYGDWNEMSNADWYGRQYEDKMWEQSENLSSMNARLNDMCNTVKAAGGNTFILFTIAFSAPVNGQTQLEKCSTASTGDLNNPGKFYFDATNKAGLDAAFDSIARFVSELKLTQ